MNIHSKLFIPFVAIAISTSQLSGCTSEDEDPFSDPGEVVGNAGIISQTQFFISADDIQPAVIEITDPGPPPSRTVDLNVEVTISISIGDRNNQILTDAHTVFFETEWGLIEPSCVTSGGGCSVTWKPSGILLPADNSTWIVAYTTGEEAFIDLNNNEIYNDGEVFLDREEPWINIDNTEIPPFFDATDILIDVVNGNDPTGINGAHDIPDGLFNGGGCTHTSLCSTVLPSAIVWDFIDLNLLGGP